MKSIISFYGFSVQLLFFLKIFRIIQRILGAPSKPHFHSPKPVYGLPNKPAINFKPPQQNYGPPKQSYGPPQQNYGQTSFQSTNAFGLGLNNINVVGPSFPKHGAGCDGKEIKYLDSVNDLNISIANLFVRMETNPRSINRIASIC